MQKLFYVYTIIGIFLVVACAAPQVIETSETHRLHFGVMMALDSFPIFVAEERGFFDEEGLSVTLNRFTSAVDRDIAFQANDNMDGLTLDLVALAMYNEGGIDKVVLASTIGIAAILGAPEIHNMEDLRGGTVLAARNSAMDYILYTALNRGGISEDEINFVEIPAVPTRMEMLINRQGEGALLPEPFKTVAAGRGLNIITDTRELDITPFAMTVRRSAVEENAEALQAFIRALNRAVDYINAAPREDIINLLTETVGFPEELRYTFEVPIFPQYTNPSAAAINSVFEFARHRGILTIPLQGQDVLINLEDPGF